MAGSNGGGFLNSDAGNALAGTIIKPEKIAGAVRNNPWVVPVAAAAATAMTGGMAAPALAGAVGAGEIGAGTAAGIGAADGLAAGGAAAGGIGADAALGAGATDLTATGAGLLSGAGADASAGGMAPIAADPPMPLQNPFGMMGPGVNPYQPGPSMFHMPSQGQIGQIGQNMMKQSMQPTPQPQIQRPPGMQQQQPAQTPSFALNQPMAINSGGAGGMQDILMRLRMMGGMQ